VREKDLLLTTPKEVILDYRGEVERSEDRELMGYYYLGFAPENWVTDNGSGRYNRRRKNLHIHTGKTGVQFGSCRCYLIKSNSRLCA